MNAPLRRVAVATALLFFALLANANWIQVVQAKSLNEKQGNARVIVREYSRERGPIIVAGKPIAASQETEDELKYLRTYSDTELYGHLTGFYSFVYGATGMEQAENSILAGTDDRFFVNRVSDFFTGEEPRGGSVDLTLNPAAQQAAMRGLAGQKGAVVALDPSTGAILAMASIPAYDPNILSSHASGPMREAFDELNADPNKPLLNRAISETYPPGSTFKLVTAAAALSSGKYTEQTQVPGPAELPLPDTRISLPNQNGQACGPAGKTTIENALRISCNTAFAAIGLDVGGDALREQADKFGFNNDEKQEIPLPVAPSVFPSDINAPQTAQSAIGQFDVRATPLQMAMVVAGIANRGVVMKPNLVAALRGPDLSVLDTPKPQDLGRAMPADVAEQLTSMMVSVVDKGTGTNARIPGVSVGGKTGTAEAGKGDKPHAWFVSFAPAENPRVAVAVVVENGGDATEVSGNRLAAPIARNVMRAVLRR